MEVSMEAEDFTFAGIEEALKNGLTTIVSTGDRGGAHSSF